MEVKQNIVHGLLEEGEAALENISATPRLDAETLMAFALETERMEMMVNPPEEPDAGALAAYRRQISRRTAGEPVAYITGSKGFYESTFMVNRSVLIPRPETEEMVDAVINRYPAGQSLSVCDVGTGSGCIAVSLAKERPAWKITATDISADAIATARKNGLALNTPNVEFILSNLFDNVKGEFDLIISNPPYVDEEIKDTLGTEVREYEPHVALFAQEKGVATIRQLLEETPEHLKPGGRFYCEIGYDQKNIVVELFDGRIWDNVEFLRDLAGHWRIVTAELKG